MSEPISQQRESLMERGRNVLANRSASNSSKSGTDDLMDQQRKLEKGRQILSARGTPMNSPGRTDASESNPSNDATNGDWSRLVQAHQPHFNPDDASREASPAADALNSKMLMDQLAHVTHMAQEYHMSSDEWKDKYIQLAEQHAQLEQEVMAMAKKVSEAQEEVTSINDQRSQMQISADNNGERLVQLMEDNEALKEELERAKSGG
eukprot:PhF_6_TR10447/c0_g1_i1/m.16546